MTEVKRSCESSSERALDPVKSIATIVGLKDKIEYVIINDSNNDSSNETKLVMELHVESKNAFNNCCSSYYHRGMVGCARGLCASVPESGLWGEMCVGGGRLSGGEEKLAQIESWIESGCSALINVAYLTPDERVKDDALLQSLVIEFADVIERHLLETNNTYLVGDTATAADIVLSFLLATAAVRTQSSLCEQTLRLVQTVLNNSMIKDLVNVDLKCLKLAEDRKVLPYGKPTPTPAIVEEKEVGKEEKQETESTVVGVLDAPAPDNALENESKEAPASAAAASAPMSPSSVVTDSDVASNTMLSKLKELNVAFNAYKHKLCNTVDELVSNVPIKSCNESHTKNLLLKDKKHGLFLITAKSNSNTSNTKAIGKALNLQGKTNLRLADGKMLDELLKVKPGCVGPLSILNDVEKKVTLVLDEALMKLKKVHSHPGRNDWSVVLEPKDLFDACNQMGHEPVLISFEATTLSTEGGKDVTGKGIATRPPSAKTPPTNSERKQQKQKQEKETAAKKESNKRQTKKGETLLALQWKKSENFAMWYSDVIVLSEMIAYYDISGCYILRPWSYKIWELIQLFFNEKIAKMGVENSYFPLFVSQDRLEKEKDHVEGFAPEVAWVTKSGEDTLAKPIAVRPTSETIMYPAFSDWIKSHRDLPLKLNQWSNVVRWEFKDPTPFLRSREFLWQEGHTAHATFEEANGMVMEALDHYRSVYEDLLAVPVIKGYKTEKEKFAGGYQTTTVEAYIPNSGRAIQGATSHNLGQNFGKMFDITFQDENGNSQIAWQTSWGLTTRSIGVMIMVHGDDNGLVLPPRVAPLQVVIVPIVSKKCTIETCGPYCEGVYKQLVDAGIRTRFDDRVMYNPGWKYNHWEQKGVPIRIEVGPRDMENEQVRVVTRHNGSKEDLPIHGLAKVCKDKLEQIQKDMFTKASTTRDNHVVKVTQWKDFVPNLEKSNLVLTPWIGGEHQDWEEWVKNKSREESLEAGEDEDARCATSVAAKTLCIPFQQPELPEGTKCIASGETAKCWVLWGRSY